MARLTLTAFLTLDGVMQAPGAPNEDTSRDFQHGGWLVPLFSADTGAVMLDIFSRADAFLLGRGTYEIFCRHWPNVKDRSDLIAAKLNSLPKYIASNTAQEFDWDGSQRIGDIPGQLESIKNAHKGELQVHGSHGLAQTLIEHNCIDEYRLFICPVMLGHGKKLFESCSTARGLQSVGARSLAGGIVYSVYRPTSGFRTGSFGFE